MKFYKDAFMIRSILIIMILIGIAVGVWYTFLREPEGTQVDFAQSVKSTFGEQAEYVNRQANFAIKYPNAWNLEIKEPDAQNRGIRLRGKTGYIDLYWGEEHEKGGCSHRISQLPIENGTIEVCNFKQKDDSEVWNEIVRDQGEMMFWANAYAASPSAATRLHILDVFSTLRFL